MYVSTMPYFQKLYDSPIPELGLLGLADIYTFASGLSTINLCGTIKEP